MSIDACRPDTAESIEMTSEAWSLLDQQLQKNLARYPAAKVFGAAAKGGSIYRWGVAVANSSKCDALTKTVSKLATECKVPGKKSAQLDLSGAADSLTELMRLSSDVTPPQMATIIAWSAALPAFSKALDQQTFRVLFESMIQLRESILQHNQPSSIEHLMLGAELGLTLAWRCDGSVATKGLKSSSVRAIKQWSDQEAESVSAAIEHPIHTRLVLASVIRCQHLVKRTTKHRWPKQANEAMVRLATWVIAMSTRNGSSMFSSASGKMVSDDTKQGGLLDRARGLDHETLDGALDAALGKLPPRGRLVWQVSLPETMHHDGDAKQAVMFPDWDVRRGRTHIDYSDETVRLEVFGGQKKVVSGLWQTMIQSNGEEQWPQGDWTEICEYSDDDVHYLEIEQPWTGGLLLQRQWMLVRDDRCVLLADSIIPQDLNASLPDDLGYSSRLPLADSIQFLPETNTREGFFVDNNNAKHGLVFPLSASEWAIGPTEAKLAQSGDNCLILNGVGAKRLYAPLWFDFQKRRFKRMRTWRQLTVADQLRLVRRDEAVAYRVQVGSEQWVVYRSLAERACRSFLGKHLIADFFASRFDPEDGGHEALVTVDDEEHSYD